MVAVNKVSAVLHQYVKIQTLAHCPPRLFPQNLSVSYGVSVISTAILWEKNMHNCETEVGKLWPTGDI